MNTIKQNNGLNFTPVKHALYILQVLVIAIAIPVLYVVDLSHKEKIINPQEMSNHRAVNEGHIKVAQI